MQPPSGGIMRDKTVVVTGGTSGIGEIAALALARAGARIVLVARESKRAEATMRRLGQEGPGLGHVLHLADLSRLYEVRRVGAEIAKAEPRIDVLINNAGAMFDRLDVTEDGFERTFATNHVAYFVLTEALRDRLVASRPARIVNTASGAHRGATLDWDDLQSTKNYSGFKAYCRSKLYNILFTRELARRLEGTGVTANCLHPGFVATRFGDATGHVMRVGTKLAKAIFAISPEKGAETIIYLAASPEVAASSGGYFAKCRPAASTAIAKDPDAARRLWDITAELTGHGPT